MGPSRTACAMRRRVIGIDERRVGEYEASNPSEKHRRVILTTYLQDMATTLSSFHPDAYTLVANNAAMANTRSPHSRTTSWQIDEQILSTRPCECKYLRAQSPACDGADCSSPNGRLGAVVPAS
jgi:hypothetical protein